MNTIPHRYLRFLKNVVQKLPLILFAAFSLSGCTSRMALDANRKSLANVSKPIGIFVLRTENPYKPSYLPQMKGLDVAQIGGGSGSAAYSPDRPYREAKNQYLEYLVSMDLNPGEYAIENIDGGGSGFLISGRFSFPVNTRFNLTSGVTYLGHLTMTNRERKEGEKRSGPVLPLIDQAVCGFSGGTFDFTITDRSATDIPDFVRAYPVLQGVNITKAIMRK